MVAGAMDMLLFLSSLTLLGFSMCYTPGPTNALAVVTGLEKGFRAVLPLAFGSAISANLTLIALGYGLGEVFVRFPEVYEVLRWLGAAYLLWLAWKISGLRLPDQILAFLPGSPAKKSHVPTLSDEIEAGRGPCFKPLTFWQAMAFQLVNVKVWLTNVIIMSNYVGANDGWQTRLFIAAGLFTVIGTSAQCVWGGLGVFMARFLTPNGIRRANLLFAALLLTSIALLFV